MEEGVQTEGLGSAKDQSCETVESERKGEGSWVAEVQGVIRGEGKLRLGRAEGAETLASEGRGTPGYGLTAHPFQTQSTHYPQRKPIARINHPPSGLCTTLPGQRWVNVRPLPPDPEH